MGRAIETSSNDFSGLPREALRASRRPLRWGVVVWGVLLAIALAYIGIVIVVQSVTTYNTSRADLGRDLIASAPLVVVVALAWAVARR